MLEKVKSRDNNILTLNRPAPPTDNGVDLDKYPISMGPLSARSKKEITNSVEANAILHREYRAPFVCPTPDRV